jgi:hypothetical protein
MDNNKELQEKTWTEKQPGKASSFHSKESISVIDQALFVKSDAEKKLVKKINYTFMPFACLILFIQV